MSSIAHQDVELDPLTKLVGRTAFWRCVSETLLNPPDAADPPALLAVDLDRFKMVNDSAGHETGDGVLQRVAKRIRGAVPADDIVARISGDEFAILLRRGGGAKAMALQLLDLIGRPYAVRGQIIAISASVGVAISPRDGVDADALMQAANIALHQAEVEGRNRHKSFEISMQDRANLRFALERDLRAAIALQQVELRLAVATGQFVLEYQPIIHLGSESVVGFEALLRWQHPVRGLVGPDSFIPLAEEIGVIGQIGTWALRCACKAAATWPTIPRPIFVSVNASPLQVREGQGFVKAVADALSESGLAPDRLAIEITESAVLEDSGQFLRTIRDMGVALCVDDFGTGFSSLSQLSQFSFDRIKIDRSFVREIGKPTAALALLQNANSPSKRSQAAWMLRAIAGLGSGLGITTVAEGVETHEQENVVRMAGVTEAQGFLYAKPVAENMVTQLVETFGAQSRSQGASA